MDCIFSIQNTEIMYSNMDLLKSIKDWHQGCEGVSYTRGAWGTGYECSIWKVMHNPQINKCSKRCSTYRLNLRCTLIMLRNKRQMRVEKRVKSTHLPHCCLLKAHDKEGEKKEKHSLSSMQTGPCLCMSSSCKAPTQHAVLHGYRPKGKTKPWEAGSLPLAAFKKYDQISVILVFPEQGVLKSFTALCKANILTCCWHGFSRQ